MRTMNWLAAIALFGFVMGSSAIADEGKAEQAGRKVDEAADKASDDTKQAAHETKRAAKRAKRKTGEKVEDAGKDLQK